MALHDIATEDHSKDAATFERRSLGRFRDISLFLYGSLLIFLGLALYCCGILFSLVRLILRLGEPFRMWNAGIVWYSGVPFTLGAVLIVLDLVFLLPGKRRRSRREQIEPVSDQRVLVALTAYNDEQSIGAAVADFRSHPLVTSVIVVDNNSHDRTTEFARRAGARVVTELTPGYGRCVYRCFEEALTEKGDLIALCEGDMTFRAKDLDKFLAYIDHADLVNGTRIVEQLRDYSTQLSTFMYYGNFFVGKLLELKHLGRGTFTDVGTTYKLVRRRSLERLMSVLNPGVNLEFNAHFLDVALTQGERLVECPITFHPRVGVSKGGNVNNLRALSVGLRMIRGLVFGWRFKRMGYFDTRISPDPQRPAPLTPIQFSLSRILVYGSIALFVLLIAISAAKPLHLDNMDFAAAAETTMKTGKPVYYRGEQYPTHLGLFHPPLYIYLLAGWFTVFGAGPAQARMFGALSALLQGWTCLLILKQLFGAGFVTRIRPWFWPVFLLSAYTLQAVAIVDIDSTIYGPLLNLFLWSILGLTWRNGVLRTDASRGQEFLLVSLLLSISLWAKLTSVWLVVPFMILLLEHRFGWRRAAALTVGIVVAGIGIFLSTYYAYGRLVHLPVLYTFQFTWMSLITRGSSGKPGLLAGLRDHWGNFYFMTRFMTAWTGFVPWICAALTWHASMLRAVRTSDKRALHLAHITLLALLGVSYYCAQVITFGAAPFKYTFVYWGLIMIGTAACLSESVTQVRKLPGLLLAAAFAGACVAGAVFTRDTMPLKGGISLADSGPLLIPAALVVLGSLLRRTAVKDAGPVILALGILLYVGLETGISLYQARAEYSTTYDYGQQGFEDTVAYIRTQTTPDQAIVSMKDIGYAARRRYYENYGAIYGTASDANVITSALASRAASLAVFTEGRGQDQLIVNPELKRWVESNCVQVASFGNYRIFRFGGLSE